MSRKRARSTVDAATRHAMRTAMTAQELMTASATVIMRRSAIGAAALERPSAAAFTEGNTMVTEKLSALAESGAATAKSGTDAAMATVGYVVQEAAALGTAAGRLAACATPEAMIAAQEHLLSGFFSRLVTHNLEMGNLLLRAGSAALTPFHTAARANARRLTR